MKDVFEGTTISITFIDEFDIGHKNKENRMRNLPEKKGYAKHVKALGKDLYAIEHIKGEDYNVAVVVLQDGRYFVGTAMLNPIDQRNKRLGHEIAVGRALFAACVRGPNGKLWNDNDPKLTGREFGNICRRVARECIPERASWCTT